MADIFGTAGGTSAALGDMQRMAQTQGQQLENQQKQQGIADQQRMSQLQQQYAAQPGTQQRSPADQLEDMAGLAMKAGMTGSGAELATKAADLRLKQSQTVQAQARTINQQATAAKTELDTVTRLLSGVTDQASWDAANNLFESMSGQKSPFRGMEYNPVVVKHLQDASMSMKDKLDTQIKEYNAKTQRMNEESAAGFRAFREKHIAQADSDQSDATDAAYKATGANAAIAPTKSEIDSATGIIEKIYPNLPANEVNHAAQNAAINARRIKKTAGLTDEQAMQRSVQQLHDLGTLDQNYAMGGMPPARAVGGYSSDAIDDLAKSYAAGNTSVVSGLGRNKADRDVRAQVISRAAAYQKSGGGDFASSPIEYKARTRGAIVNAQQGAKVDAAANALSASGGIGDQFQQAIDALDRTRVPIANEAQMEVLRRSNDPRVSAYDTAKNGVVSEVAQILGRGTVTVNSMDEARKVIDGWHTSAQARAGLAQLKREAATTVKSSNEEVSRSAGTPAATPAPGGQDFSHLWN